MSELVWPAILLLILILLNGLFALAEIALVSARKTRLEQSAAAGHPNAQKALQLLEDPGKFLSTVQVGITLVGTVAGVFSGASFSRPLTAWLAELGVPAPWAHNLSLALVVLVIAYLSLTLGELVPKRIALSNPERFSTLTAGLMQRLSRLTAPLVWFLSHSTDLLLRMIPLTAQTEGAVTEDDIRALIRQGAQMGVLKPEEQDMLDRLLRLDERRVSAIMTPRRDLVYLTLDMSTEEILAIIREHRYSRYPLCGDDVDQILGVVHIRDLALGLTEAERPGIKDHMFQPLFVLDATRALHLLRQFKSTGVHIAIVQDEFGGVEGIVTLNDIFQSIVGSLPEAGEEHDPDIVVREDGSWLISGSIPIDEVRALVPQCANLFELDASYETLGGFIMLQLGHIPKPSEVFSCGGVRFEVMDMDERRVDKVLVQLESQDGEIPTGETVAAEWTHPTSGS